MLGHTYTQRKHSHVCALKRSLHTELNGKCNIPYMHLLPHIHTTGNDIPGDPVPRHECSSSSPSLNLPFSVSSSIIFLWGKILSISLTYFWCHLLIYFQQSPSLYLSPSLPPVHCSVTRAACAVLCQWILRLPVKPCNSLKELRLLFSCCFACRCCVLHFMYFCLSLLCDDVCKV